MISVRIFTLATGVMLLSLPAAAQGGEYRDPSGFSLTYPDDWDVISKADVEQRLNALSPQMKTWIQQNNLDLKRLLVVILHSNAGDFQENFNVSVFPEMLPPLTEQSVSLIADAFTREFRSRHVALSNVSHGIKSFGSHNAMVFECTMRIPGAVFPVRQKYILLSSGTTTYLFVGSSKVDQYAQCSPTFDAMIASFKAPASSPSGSVASAAPAGPPGEYRDPSGFSFALPDDWIVATDPVTKRARPDLPPKVKEWLASHNLKFGDKDVIVLHLDDVDSMDMLQVKILSSEIPINAGEAKAIAAQIESGLQADGAILRSTTNGLQTYGDRPAIFFARDITVPGAPTVKVRDVIFSGGGRSYLVTCTSLPNRFAQAAPAFDRILASFQLPASASAASPAGRHFSFSMSRFDPRRMILYAFVGCCVALLVGLFKRVLHG